MSQLTQEWSVFDPDKGYEKEMQDIKLKNGAIVTMCWPNAGVWVPHEKQPYYGTEIPCSEVAEVRLTHSIWY